MRLLPLLISMLVLAPASAFAREDAQALTVQRCVGLKGMTLLSRTIGLPTTGGEVVDALWKADGPEDGPGAHCLVNGVIHPVDPTAPDIRFAVALPRNWNSKAVMLGGGGYNGVVPDVTGLPVSGPAPLAKGYAVFASDSGHQATPVDPGAFALNDEAYRNWMGDALKKTRDASLQIVERAYGQSPVRSYFFGGSTGGREALAVAGRWPLDWDGVVSLFPARNVTTTILGMLAATQTLAEPGAFLNVAERGVAFRSALETCDGLDGLKDGVISDVRGCHARFDPATASLDGAPVRCPQGRDVSDACLSDAQIAALKKLDGPVPFNFPLAGGQTDFPGYNILTSDTGSVVSPVQPVVAALSLGADPSSFPLPPAASQSARLTDNHVRFVFTRDPGFNALTFDVSDPEAYAARLAGLSALDVGDTDLTAFASRGGKVLLMHGTDDMLVTPRGTERYFQNLRTTMGAEIVEGFLRFYEIPGYGHSVGSVFGAQWDSLTALEQWVEAGVDPAENQIVEDATGVPGRTRPLCLYPSWPQYRGSGDVNAAASFTCATS